jgi:predicted nucleic acid-binding protein
VRRIVLDSGALIALEHDDRPLWAALKLAGLASTDVLVPSTCLAQVWRGTARQARLGRALQHCLVAAFDPLAREVGELCGRTRTTDICDAHVALVAARQGDVLYTSDPRDLRRLLAAIGGERAVAVIRC